MKKEYDFTKGIRGKFHRTIKIQKTLRLDKDVLEFYQNMAMKNGIPYQTLINLVLKKFVAEEASLVLSPV
ncbi:MAG: hypothetical protein ACD_62C00608G0009 [uncultured bacterium]|nr:MAG: hypothetical protein ACD_62C00608G0009 [uncultured bacterium]HLD44963.1 BrnA antitoxin family protein [bacterium]